MNKLLVIHPKDASTEFLNTIWRFLSVKIGDKLSLHNIGYTDEKHASVIEEVSKYDGKNILFLGHGTSISLKGSKNEHYKKDIFIGKNDLAIFSDKNVLSFSCKSIDFFRYTKHFNYVGFDDIPSDMAEVQGARELENTIYQNVDEEIIEDFKIKLVRIISNSVYEWISSNYNMENVYHRIMIRINKEITNVLKSQQSQIKKKAMLSLLNNLKRDMGYNQL